MSRELGIIGQEVFDELCKGAEVDSIERCLLRYLPAAFKSTLNCTSESEHGVGKVFSLRLMTGAREHVKLPPSTEIPEWASRFHVRILIRIRFRPEHKKPARMLVSATVEIQAEEGANSFLHEEIVSRKFLDIDKAFDFAIALV